MRWILILMMLSACDAKGTRGQTGECPSGETCSPATPNGLEFVGSQLVDQPLGRMAPLVTAVGGTQSIRVLAGPGTTSAPFAMPFISASSGPAFRVSDNAPPDVEVAGLVAGQAYLRILDPATNELFDRLSLDVAPVDHVAVAPLDFLTTAADSQFAAGTTFHWALIAEGDETCALRLFAADGTRLADERTVMSASGALTATPPPDATVTWDAFTVRGVSAGDGTLAIRTGDGAAHDTTIRVVATVDDIANVDATSAIAPGQPLPVGLSNVCFRALNSGDLVAGAHWRFAGGSAATTAAGPTPNCVALTVAQAGPVTVMVNVGGFTKSFSFTAQ